MHFKYLIIASFLACTTICEAIEEIEETKELEELACQSDVVCQPCCSCYQASLDFHAGRGLGYDKSYGSFRFFGVPRLASPCQPFSFFIDLRSHLFTNGKSAGNIGLGVRYEVNQMTFGANLYYDMRNTHHRFQQFGAGLEFLSPCLDIRLNGYFPQKKSHLTECAFFDDFIGDFFEVCRLHEFAYTGFDGEVGRSLYTTTACSCYFSLYAALGTYYFHSKNGCNFWGGQARVRMDLTQFIALEVFASTDRIFCERVQGIITLSIPFGPCSYSCRQAPICTPPYRREIIVLDKRCHYRNNF